MRWVVDASALLHAALPDGVGDSALLPSLRRGGPILAPALLASECGMVVHRKLPLAFGPDAAARTIALELMLEQVDSQASTGPHRRVAGALAEQERLSFYDAEYLALAVTHEAALLTEDGPLRQAAERVLGRDRATNWARLPALLGARRST